jgi:uncharacterized protein YfaS (alpha-2-macroglobulin family)
MSRISYRRIFLGLLLIVSLSLVSVGFVAMSQSDKKDPQPPSKTTADARWKEVDRLINEQKFNEALTVVDKILTDSQASGDQDNWTKALVRGFQLRSGLHSDEVAVRTLREATWPEGFLHRATLNLFYAQALVDYYQAYSWEINNRELVTGQPSADLKTWTRAQLYAEARGAYETVWKQRDQLGAAPVAQLGEYIRPNDYPAGIRSTLRDAVSYLYTALLANTSLWTAEEENEVYRLNLADLLGDARPDTGSDQAVHPMQRLTAVLKDLEAWHQAEGQPEAALEARLERLRRLRAAFDQAEDRAKIQASLERILPQYRDYPWWSMGQELLAQIVQDSSEPGRLVRARAIAEAGYKAYPDSIGGRRCLYAVKSIEAPAFTLQSMANDAPKRRSLLVTHKNLEKLYFRAYAFDLLRRVSEAKDYNLLLDAREQETLLRSATPAAQWSVGLPATPDFENHNTYVTPPMEKTGYYVIIGSATPEFGKRENTLTAVNFIVTDLVLLTRQSWTSAVIEAQLLAGSTGEPIPGAQIDLYRYDWNRGHRRESSLTTDQNGCVRFQRLSESNPSFLIARHDGDMVVNPEYLYNRSYEQPSDFQASLVYTDRSVYRPNQKLFWKVLAYAGGVDRSKFRPLPARQLEVRLYDANNQVVDTRTVTTNDFGTVAGEFMLPLGRLLGRWHVQALIGSRYGEAYFRVEEYKRPTFEAKLKDPESALRLNRPAQIKGEAKYYFGLPVASGQVRWRVSREPVYPWWWSWFGWSGGGKSITVAAGGSAVQEDGTFEIAFTPEVDEREAKQGKDVTYRYTVSADVTDEGGETQSAQRSFRLGFVSVEASLSPETAFFREKQPIHIRLNRTDLNGVARPGKATWRLVALKQPDKAVPPADLPVRGPEETEGADKPSERFKTPGDLLRSRWDPRYSAEAELRAWPDGAEKARGQVTHDENGQASLELAAAPPGAYRLIYETLDDFGQTYRTTLEFIVAGAKTPLSLPALLLAERTNVEPGQTARFFAASGLANQPMFFEVYRDGLLTERRKLTSGHDSNLIEVPVTEDDRGGFSVRLAVVNDHQLMQGQSPLFVPWDNKELKLELSTFRDKLLPGQQETWTVKIKNPDGREVGTKAAEVLAYMYDRSLDVFEQHSPPSVIGIWPSRVSISQLTASLGPTWPQMISSDLVHLPDYPLLTPDQVGSTEFMGYGIGGPGRRRFNMVTKSGVLSRNGRVPVPAAPVAAVAGRVAMDEMNLSMEAAPQEKEKGEAKAQGAAQQPSAPLRADFSETAFWQPQLLSGPDGSVDIQFKVPDSVTSWNFWIHAITKDLLSASMSREARTVKDLMARPYMPRFLREGDQAELKVVVNNAGEKDFKGDVKLDIIDPETDQSLLSQFGLKPGDAARSFEVKPGRGTNVSFPLVTPVRVGSVVFKVVARSGAVSDGEQRQLPLLPGRMHLAQSRFVTLKDQDRRELVFDDLKKSDDPSRINDQLVVTVDAQLFYSALSALPYLVHYPYECTEQTLNRFVSSGILSSLYKQYPAVAKMAEEMARRDTQFETWDSIDPNRKMALEETPWLVEAKGGDKRPDELLKVLDPRVARAEQASAIAKLKKAQTSIGAFPWWPGGPPSPYMTLYIMHGLARASEFDVDVPRDMVRKGWNYLGRHYREDLRRAMMRDDCCWEFLTFLNYVASCYPDPDWVGEELTTQERQEILAFCFKHWKQHSPYSKSQLALTLKRMGRPKDAELVFASVMDSAKTTRDEGTFWAPEDRSWLWYNDTIETHAFALRALMELMPADPRTDGLVHWLFLNKKLNHWKSTRATAEVVYSLAHYLKSQGTLAIREEVKVTAGPRVVDMVFEPDRYTGKKNQVVLSGPEVGPQVATIVVEKPTRGLAFASATWHFSTEKMPETEQGDLLGVSRRYFLREKTASGFTLTPITDATRLAPGDEIEVQLSVRAKHPCEYVHLRDPRPAGFEPGVVVSRYKWEFGIAWYEETRDSGTNFFFEDLPQGEYTLKYRVRANMSGVFKAGPATLQSMYAPEFTAYSTGAVLKIAAAAR